MHKIIPRVVAISLVCVGFLNADLVDKGIGYAKDKASGAIDKVLDGKDMSVGDIFGFNKGYTMSGSLGGMQYGCSLNLPDSDKFGLGNFSFGSIFKNIDLGFVKCSASADLDKATCKNKWFDKSKQKAYEVVKKNGKEWGQKGKDWLEHNVFEYAKDKSGIWGYGDKAKKVADNYCDNLDNGIWGSKGESKNIAKTNQSNDTNSSIVEKQQENIKYSQALDKLLDFTFANSSLEYKNNLKNNSCFKDGIKEKLKTIAESSKKLDDDMKKSVDEVAKACVTEFKTQGNSENVAKSAVSAQQMTTPSANGQGTDMTYTSIKNKTAMLYNSINDKAVSECKNRNSSVAEKQSCIESMKNELKAQALEPQDKELNSGNSNNGDNIKGSLAQVYQDENEAFNQSQRVKYDLMMTAYPEKFAELKSLDGVADTLVTTEQYFNEIEKQNRHNARVKLERISYAEKLSIQEQLGRLHIQNATISAEPFDKQGAVQETELIVSKSQEVASNVVKQILGSSSSGGSIVDDLKDEAKNTAKDYAKGKLGL